MGHYFKYLGTKESSRTLWENEEALSKYLERLKEFWDEEKNEWLPEPKESESRKNDAIFVRSN